MKGLYTELNTLIAQAEDERKMAIDVNVLMREVQYIVNLDSMPISELKDRYARAAASCALYQCGYKSVIPGEGIFVNVEHCKEPEYIRRFYNNAKYSERQKTAALERIKKKIKEEGIEGQMKFTLDGDIETELSVSEIIDMLRADAGSEEKEA